MESADFTFQTEDGTRLHVSGWAVEEPKAIVQVLHGIAEHGSRYARLAEALARAGYTTYAHDHRGHGKSLLEGSPPGHIADSDGWSLLVEDSHAVNREISRRHPGLPIIVLGHSMGSFVLQQLLFEYPRDMVAAAVSGSNGKPPAIAAVGKLLARIERARVGRRRPSPIIQSLTFGGYNKAFAPARTEFDWLSRDTDEVDAYIADTLCGFAVSTQTWLDMLNALGRIANPDNVARVKLLGGYDVRYGLHKGMKWREVPRHWMLNFALTVRPGDGKYRRIRRTCTLEYLDRSRELVASSRLCKRERKMLEPRQGIKTR